MFGVAFSYINTFLAYALTYVSLVIDLLLIPRGAIAMLFDYFLVLFSIYLITIVIKFIVTIYNKFKL